MTMIVCPFCGPRDFSEFAWGGESHVTRPTLSATDGEWADYLFNRNNHRGHAAERWHHRWGCEQWFNLVRDTLTHAVMESYAMGLGRGPSA